MNPTLQKLLLFSKRIILKDRYGRNDSATTLGNAETGQLYTPQAGTTWGVSTGKAYIVSNSTDADVLIDCGAGNIEYEGVASNSAWGTRRIGLIVRGTDDDNYLLFNMNDTVLRLYKQDANTYTQLSGDYAFVPVNGQNYTLKIIAVGNSIVCYIDGVEAINYALTGDEVAKFSSAKTLVGLFIHNSLGGNAGARFDDLTIAGR